MRKKATLLIAMVVIFLYGAIAHAEDFSISQTKTTINVGETIDLDISGTGKAAVWKSYNANIAKVSQKGEVTALKSGKTTIWVRAGLKFKTCQVTVVNTSIKINKTSATLYSGGNPTGTLQLKATAKGTAKDVKWESDDTTIATVDNNGKVSAVSSGKTVITASANGMTVDCNITVRESSISLNCNAVKLGTKGAGNSITLTPCVIGATNKVVWATSNKNVATVSGGKIVGKNEGTAVITATANGVSAQCDVVVSNDVTANMIEPSLNILEDTVCLKTKGDNKTYTVAKSVVGATNKVTWTTSNKNVATVSNGKITAKKAGTAVITATANGKEDTVNVVVEDFTPTISLNQKQCTLYTKKGNTATLKATVDGNSKVVTWKSSDANIVTVNKGKITAVSAGTANIEATANGVTATCKVTVLETEVDLSSTQLNLSVGETANILADVTGVSSTVKWASSVSKVATVKNGVITAKKAGETDIKATANGVTTVCHVIVAERCNHEYDNGVPRKQATCNSVGSVVYTCTICGSNYNEPTKMETHQYKDTIINPDCEQSGYTEHTCIVCGDSYRDNETSPLGHKMVESSVVQPTCMTLGSIIYTCDVCGKSETEDIPMVDHSYGNWTVVKEATTTAEGKRQRICSICEHEDEETIPKIPEGHTHRYEKNIKEATCETDGYIEYTCSCGDSYKETIIATGHKKMDWQVTKKATCSSMGTEAIKCSVCGEILDTRDIPVTEHLAGDWVVTKQPSCTETGEKVKTCSVCKKDVDTETISMIEHTKSKWTVVTEASCEKMGMEEIHCTVCNKTLDTRIIEAKQHSYTTTATEATCTTAATTTSVCDFCGDSNMTTVSPALGHDASDWKVSVAAMCTNGGTEVKVCNRCSETVDSRTTDALGHNFVAGETTAPTCESGGYTLYGCSRCAETEQRDKTEKLAHQQSDWQTITEANCVSPEVQGTVCLLCGETLETKTLTEYGDHYDEVYKVINPTPCSKGWTTYRCKFCRRTIDCDYVPATGSGQHVWDLDAYYMQSENYYLVPCKNCTGKKVYKSVEEIEKDKQAQLDDEKAVQKVTEVIKQIIDDDMTDAEKVFAVNNWICRNCEYDEETYKWVMQNGGLLFSCDVTEARGVMLHGKAVCSGYSKAFKEFMDQLGIDCRIVSSSRMNHDWNQVRLDDGWYWLDTTWNDDENSNGFFFTKYFLLTSKRVFNYQTVTDETGGEECSGTKHLKGASIFEKYFVETQEDINNMYLLQKDNKEIYVRGGSNILSLLSTVRNEYNSKFGETITTPFISLNDGTRVGCFNNTDKLKQFFENRIDATEIETAEVVNVVSDDDNSDENISSSDDSEENLENEEFDNEEVSSEEATEVETEIIEDMEEETAEEFSITDNE